MVANRYGVSFWGGKNVLQLVLMVVQPHEYTKNHLTFYFQRVNFMLCELYLSKIYICIYI